MTNRLSRVLLTALLASTLAACGSDSPASSTGDSAVPGVQVSAQHNDADVAFVRDMTPHHEGAVDMSALAATRAGDERVKELAERIEAAQAPEVDLMAQLAKAWDVDVEGGAHGGGHGGGHDGDEDVQALEPLSGTEFDREFLTRMIAHHESALPMAHTEIEQGENSTAQELAQEIVRTQQAEIAEMRELLAQL
jgi:uncharacterized protein (DUF305 family)